LEVLYGLRLIGLPTSMTLNDLERRNSPYFVFCFTEFDCFAVHYVKVVEDRPIMAVKYCFSVPVFHFWPTYRAARSLCDSWATSWYL